MSKLKILEAENGSLKKKLTKLQKEITQLRSQSRPLSSRATKTKESAKRINNFGSNSKLDEKSYVRNAHKRSSSRVIVNDELGFNDLGSPRVITQEKNHQESIPDKSMVSELSSLKEENKLLRQKLKNPQKSAPRSVSRGRLPENSCISSKKSKLSYCKICAKLLSKGYTTRFCPKHGQKPCRPNTSYTKIP